MLSYIQTSSSESELLTLIDGFFCITEIFQRETEMATRIQRNYRTIIANRGSRKLDKSVRKILGRISELEELPQELLTYILSFLPKRELYTISQLSKDFNDIALQDCFWKTFKLKNRSKDYDFSTHLVHMLDKCKKLQILNLSFCMAIDERNISMLSSHIKEGNLKKLYLDGWEKVNDNALSVLTGRDPNFLQTESLSQYTSRLLKDSLPSRNQVKQKGLELLSLSEWRNVHWSGVMKLDKLKNLKNLNLLGWVSVKDEGIKHLNKNNDNLETLNLGGTGITSEWIYFIVQEGSISLKNVNIVGCKKLKNTDQELLKTHGFNVIGGEDVFRFNLLPEPFSGLRKITQSVLKTRSTLSIYRVYKYLAKRLISDMNLLTPEMSDNNFDHDEFITSINLEIHCQGVVLEPHMQLREILDNFWTVGEDLLTLHYRNKKDSIDKEEIRKEVENYPTKPPVWVPDNIAYSCAYWDKDFSILLRIHHWRSWGRWFWNRCSNFRISLPKFGYTDPVRVCIEWHKALIPEKDRENIENLSQRNTNSIIYGAAAEIAFPGILASASTEQNIDENGHFRLI